MASNVSSLPENSYLLSTRPDPIPTILSRHRSGRVRLVIVSLVALTGTALALDHYLLPNGWFFMVLGWILVQVILGNVYAESLGRQPYVASMLDLILEKAWSTAKLLLIVLLGYAIYDVSRGIGVGDELAYCWRRLIGMGEILAAGPVNLYQVACLAPWLGPLREVVRMVRRAREFEVQLCPRVERRINQRIHEARQLAAKGQKEQAGAMLQEASELLATLAGYASDEGILYHRRLLRHKVNALMGLPVKDDSPADPFFGEDPRWRPAPFSDIDALFPASPPAGEPAGNGPNRNGPSKVDQGYEQYREFLESLREKSTATWADVAGLDEVVSEMKTVLAMGLARAPHGVKLEPPRRILLYGPPGTGKTLLTSAISNSFDAPFYNVKVSDVLSKFFGESTRLLSALFELASSKGPAVIFIDEIESISGNREAAGSDGEERRMISALLAQLDGLKSRKEGPPLFTIAATNLPWQLDPAILSRFEKQFFIPLPDHQARRRILDIHLAERGFQVQAAMDKLVESTRGYSGRELSRLCQEAVRLMLADANPKMEDLADHGQQAMSNYKLKLSAINVHHLSAAFKKVRPQTDPHLLDRYHEWQRQAS